MDGSGWRDPPALLPTHYFLLGSKAPHPKNLIRYFRLWGVEDVFAAITRKPTSRQAFWLSVQGLETSETTLHTATTQRRLLKLTYGST